MKKIKTLLVICFALVAFAVLAGCEEIPACEHETGSWAANAQEHWQTCGKCNEQVNKGAHTFGEFEVIAEPAVGIEGTQVRKCTICEEVIETRQKLFGHKFITEELAPTCDEDGYSLGICEYCNFEKKTVLKAKGHTPGEYEYSKTGKDQIGRKVNSCLECGDIIHDIAYANNGYFAHGKLSVVGTDLVDKDGEKVQLYGLSTHGIQWFGKYLNYGTIEALQNEFGINVIRFALYTDENGYCSGTEAKKKEMLADLKEGIEAASKLGLYVIIDWHMVGADNPLDKNPLTYLNESKEFFGMISELYKDHDNILYEIMNEPNGSTTWDDCKKYAYEIIPCIRKNSDGIVLVGNPKWTADLYSVCNSPLVGFDNIMYTYHFYAADHKSTTQVEYAYSKGFPVFISEYGMMLSSGDGDIDPVSGMNWIKVLDDRNISYVAWNISNSGGSASIFKQGSTDMIDVSDSNLKEWGIFLKEMYRKKAKLD